jgi:hypothetical protein
MQTITYCGFNHHSQNGIVECSFHSLYDCAHTIIIHAIDNWPDVVIGYNRLGATGMLH